MWLLSFIKSSIGKKMVMASSGLLLILFLAIHAFGNAAIYMGSKYFQIYADTLHGFPVLVLIFSVGLLAITAAHIFVGVLLFLESRSERYSRYAVNTRVVENTFASRTMPYTGLFILLFLIIHVFGFNIAAPADISISTLVKERFSVFFYSLFYITAFIALAIHLNHGFWSMLQTFGFNHPKYNYLIAKLTIIVPLFFLVLFGGIPIYFMTGAGAAY
ncbi:MAG: succinate dehydrogenase cytochrome b subunit [Desulfobacterales bacterium]|nr:succinate dehydrogenase cytochrome b subunit [Deltaproteobacteria bacterium]MBT8362083.1 succinate dehydrogenase cytochrome b subunit [Deltaproteobacteria bacterium]NNK96649.1 succinate dehydrogenase cytochrome b subunit [Desulfobacterales bacterium]